MSSYKKEEPYENKHVAQRKQRKQEAENLLLTSFRKYLKGIRNSLILSLIVVCFSAPEGVRFFFLRFVPFS